MRRFQVESLEPRRVLTIAIESIPSITIGEGDIAVVASSFQDSSPNTFYSASIDWGDGTKSTPSITVPGRASGSLTARIDYQYDTNGFFDSAAKRAAMNAAAQSVLDRFGDQFAGIGTSATDQFSPIISDPGTGNEIQLAPTSIGTNEILIFVGGRDLGETTLAFGGGGGYSASGSNEFQELAATRGQPADSNVDYAPWGGHIAFDIDANWHFGLDATTLTSDAYDFFTVATHEMLHLMGFNDSVDAFRRHVSNDRFGGPNAIAAHDINGAPRLSPDHAHWGESVRNDGQIPLMAPNVVAGRRATMTQLDLAAMQDIGWEPLEPTDGTIQAEHVFANDGVYFGAISLSDSTDAATAPFRIIVDNIAPRLIGVSNRDASVDQPITFDTTIVDPGVNDSHEISVDWGDGTQEDLSIDLANKTATATHAYANPGNYTVEFRVTDDDDASRTQRATVAIELVSNSVWQNRSEPRDVNNDGTISPIDALLVINELNRPTVSELDGRLPTSIPDEDAPAIAAFFDVNGDEFVSANDALLVINELNRAAATKTSSASQSPSDNRVAAAIDFIFATDDRSRSRDLMI